MSGVTKKANSGCVSRQRVLLFVGAHPDDETFGIGGTLAQYALAGVKVYYACATRGEAGSADPQYMKGYSTFGDMRWDELKRAAKILGLADVIYLGYHDSGMRGSESNKLPNALATAPLEEEAGRMVKIIRELKPDVVLTHDAGGGYGHPDHIATHDATIKAFYAAGDSSQYPESSQAFQPRKLYFSVRPRGLSKMMVKLMPLFGKDPRHFGRNGDIDLTVMVSVQYPVHAVISLSKQAINIQNKAAACHASQGGNQHRPGPFRILQVIERLQGQKDYFMRDYPVPTSQHREKDLFDGVK